MYCRRGTAAQTQKVESNHETSAPSSIVFKDISAIFMRFRASLSLRNRRCLRGVEGRNTLRAEALPLVSTGIGIKVGKCVRYRGDILHEFGAQAHGMRQCTVEIAAKGFVAFHTIRPFRREFGYRFTGLYTYVHVHRQMNIPNWYSTTGIFMI